MRRTSPDLVGTRKTIFSSASVVLLALMIGYVLWTNYVVFVGGNLPLTSISLGEGSTGAGLTMLFIGDLVAVLVLWYVLGAVLLNLLYMVLRAGNPHSEAPAQQQWQPEPAQQQWQPQPQQQWQPQPAQQHWQPQPQQQWQPQQGSSSPPPPVPPAAPRDGAGQATLVAPNPQVNHGFDENEAGRPHRGWTSPPNA